MLRFFTTIIAAIAFAASFYSTAFVKAQVSPDDPFRYAPTFTTLNLSWFSFWIDSKDGTIESIRFELVSLGKPPHNWGIVCPRLEEVKAGKLDVYPQQVL